MAPADPTPAPPAAAESTGAAIERLVSALQDPTRRGILLSFYDDPAPRTVDDVAAQAGIHRTVAFGHLERLARLGFLTTTQRRGVPGKPAHLYALAAGPLELHHPARQFATLAGLLAASLDGFGDPGLAAARDAGRRHAELLCPPGPARTAEAALLPLAAVGGAYDVDGERVLARNCIFREACAAAPRVVCELHAGMIEGALCAAGQRAEVEALGHAGEAPCAYRVRPAPHSR